MNATISFTSGNGGFGTLLISILFYFLQSEWRKLIQSFSNRELHGSNMHVKMCSNWRFPLSADYHRNCYGRFTDKNKIKRLPKPMHSKEEPSCSSNKASGSGRRSLQRAVQPVNWNLCIFCQSADQKAQLISVMTKQLHNCSRLIPCWNQHYLSLGWARVERLKEVKSITYQ